MLHRPDQATLRDLDNLQRTQPWAPTRKYLERELAETMERLLVTRDQYEMWTLQGRAQVIKEFLALVRDAEKASNRGAG